MIDRLQREGRTILRDELIQKVRERYRFCVSIIPQLQSHQDAKIFMNLLGQRARTFLTLIPEELHDWPQVLEACYYHIVTLPISSEKKEIFENIFEFPELLPRLSDDLVHKMFIFILNHGSCMDLDEYIMNFGDRLPSELIEQAQALIKQRGY